MNQKKLKKTIYIILLILFIPFAAFSLFTQQFLLFFGVTLLLYIALELMKKYWNP